MKHSNKTNWERLKNMKDKDINYSDIPKTDADFWEDAQIVYGIKKKEITIKVDEDIAEWIEQFGENSDKTINYIFRSYFTGLKNINFGKL